MARTINAYVETPSGERFPYTPDPRYIPDGTLGFPHRVIADAMGLEGDGWAGCRFPLDYNHKTVEVEDKVYEKTDTVILTRLGKGDDGVSRCVEESPRLRRVVRIDYREGV